MSPLAVYPVSGAGVMNSNIGLADSSDAGSAGGTGHFGTAATPTASLTGEAMDFASAVTTMEQLVNPNAAYHPLHLVSDSEVTVSFRDGHELLEKTELDPLVRNLETPRPN